MRLSTGILLASAIVSILWLAAGYTPNHGWLALSPTQQLCSAVHRQDVAAVQSLIDRGACRQGYSSQPALYIAVRIGDVRIVRMLVKGGISPNARDAGGWTPLMVAAQANGPADGSLEVAAELLRLGAAPNTLDDRGFTALDHASYRSNTRIAALLHEAGCKPSGKSWTLPVANRTISQQP